MRAHVPSYELRAARSLKDALALLRDEPGTWKPFAGGTDVMVLFEAGKLAHRRWLSLWGLGELRGVEVAPAAVTIGALTTYTQLQAHALLAREFPMLGSAASQTGAVAIQNRGTLGGNIMNASPAADSPPALLAYDAEVELTSAAGARWVPYAGFHTGYKTTVARADEILTRVRLPRQAEAASLVHHYRKVGTRQAQAISKTCLAALARVEDGTIRVARVALGSVAPTAIRCRGVEALLVGARVDAGLVQRARAALEKEIAPIDDIRSTREYRLRVTGNLLEEFLLRCGTGSAASRN
jgi:CO/xanthine dehydrogenase FAD-binding subunit